VSSFLLAVLLAISNPAALDDRLAKEVERLDAALHAVKPEQLPPSLRETYQGPAGMIVSARDAKSPLVRLARLRYAIPMTEQTLFTIANADSSTDQVKLRALWTQRRGDFALPYKSAGGALIRQAISESAYNRGQKLYRASLPYGKVSGTPSGLFYLGEAEGNVRLRRFVEGLDLGGDEHPPSAAALRAALESLRAESLKIAGEDPVSRATIAASSAMKEAEEELDLNLLAGATMSLLEARLFLSRRTGKPVAAAPAPDAPPGDSMLELWRASMLQPTVPENTAIIHDDVIPLYLSLRRSS
jgi:hypothetical protein